MSYFALANFNEPYPQQLDTEELSWLDQFSERVRETAIRLIRMSPFRLNSLVHTVEEEEKKILGMSEAERQSYVSVLQRDLRRHGLIFRLVCRSFALVRVYSTDVLNMRHYPSQIRGGYVLLHGYLAEMDTGEGKTLTATLAACTAALAGYNVHVITVNDYLAKRDAEQMGVLYRCLGLSTGLIQEGMQHEQKRQAYQQNIVYCTSKTVVFDYLRDRLATGDSVKPVSMSFRQSIQQSNQVMLKGLQYAIVDEADSIFIDEARTPLIISEEHPDEDEENFYRHAIDLASQLIAGEDYIIHAKAGRTHLTVSGGEKLALLAESLGGIWNAKLRREEIISQALAALHDFIRDVNYLVRDDKVMIIDENTGRVMPDRSWERGLQQLIEVKENVSVSPQKETIAKISFQLFFRRYLRLSGMTGTCREVAGEVGDVYGLRVVRVKPNQKSRRITYPARVLVSSDERWQRIVDATREQQDRGRPVLLGTRSIKASEELSDYLQAAGISHQLLNAKQDKEEADIIAQAGHTSRVTIATNMAGRGTDIKLFDEVTEKGGLHVILSERYDNRRIDRQLCGRCARQGDPGSWQEIISMEDSLVGRKPTTMKSMLIFLLARYPDNTLVQFVARTYMRLRQLRIEYSHRRIRRRLLSSDFGLRRSLSFSGRME